MDTLVQILIWWFLATTLGFIALPVTTRLFGFLPDRGLGLARLTGLLLTSYVVWLIGFVHYSAVTSVLAWLALAGLSAWIYKNQAQELRDLIKEKGGLLIIYEVLFLVLLALWALVRTRHHDIVDQEKFMDFAFFNAIQRAGSFPPFDPWLAGDGNHINYYYFGYFIMSNFARLTPLAPDVAYNMVVAFVFALCGQAVFSIAYNTTRAVWTGYVGVAFLQVFGNLEMATLQAGQKIGFANWWNPTRLIRDVVAPAAEKGGRFVNHWWHSANEKVLAAHGLTTAASRDAAISEFPAFSFLHGDIHPHFVAMPFVLLALAAALNLLKNDHRDPAPLGDVRFGPSAAVAAALLGVLAVLKPGFVSAVPAWLFVLGALIAAALAWPRDWERGIGLGLVCLSLGVVAMTNTWDLPAYGMVTALCLLAHQHHHQRLAGNHWMLGWLFPSFLILGGLLALAGPFFAAFVNPAQGAAFNLAKTGLRDTLIFWGLFLMVILPYLGTRVRVWALSLQGRLVDAPASAKAAVKPAKAAAKSGARNCKSCGSKLRPGKPFCPQCGTKNPEKKETEKVAPRLASISGSMKLPVELVPGFLKQCLTLMGAPLRSLSDKQVSMPAKVTVGVALLLFAVLAAFYPTSAIFFAVVVLAGVLLASREESPDALFATVLLLVGGALVLGVEWVLVKDTFYGGEQQGSLGRMNTIFKFYFQAWILFAAAVPFLIWWMVTTVFRAKNVVWRFAFILPLLALSFMALKYPLGAYSWVARNNRASGIGPTLDGADWFKRRYPSDWAAVEKLRRDVKGAPVIAEAVGNQYTHFARVASYTGLPTIVGWGGHELQWRGEYPTEAINDAKRLYETRDVGEMMRLLQKYDVTYVFVGELERREFSNDSLIKFDGPLDVFFRDRGTVIYKVKGR